MAITSGFNHVATLTPDLDRFKAWYNQVFDAETMFEMDAREDHPRMAIVELGAGAALNVFETDEESLIGERHGERSITSGLQSPTWRRWSW